MHKFDAVILAHLTKRKVSRNNQALLLSLLSSSLSWTEPLDTVLLIETLNDVDKVTYVLRTSNSSISHNFTQNKDKILNYIGL